jgi:lipid A 3-O-deacylase
MKRKTIKRLGLLGGALCAGCVAFSHPSFADELNPQQGGFRGTSMKTSARDYGHLTDAISGPQISKPEQWWQAEGNSGTTAKSPNNPSTSTFDVNNIGTSISEPDKKADYHSNIAQMTSGAAYDKNRLSLQIVLGSLYAPCGIGPEIPHLAYAQANLRLGWMMSNPSQWLFFPRGNLESIVEFSNSIVYNGFGHYFGGISALIRYNMVQPAWRLFPYLQIGGGVVYTDAYKDRSQRAVGQAIEFLPQAGLGVRYQINPTWSIDAEVIFHHISNAGLAHRNIGVNATGGVVGCTFYLK